MSSIAYGAPRPEQVSGGGLQVLAEAMFDSPRIEEYVKAAQGFGALAKANVSFYDATCALTHRPQSMQLLRMRLKVIPEAAEDYPD